MRIAFYAPMKSPNHPVPSGDRRIANLFLNALSTFADPFLASEFRSYEGKGLADRQTEIRTQGLAEADALLNRWQNDSDGPAPDLWFTYHLYHKAPDWLGPRISKALQIPYVIAEASHAPKQDGGRWDLNYHAAADAIAAADKVLAMTHLDHACLSQLTTAGDRLLYFPPFVDSAHPNANADRQNLADQYGLDPTRPWLLSVAMMRPGDKERSYELLAESFAALSSDNWQAILIGSGDVEDKVARLFETFGSKVKIIPAQRPDTLNAFYVASDLYLWPAHNEAYGMTFLEAQSQGLPVIAGAEAGVKDVVRAGETAILTPPGDWAAFATAVDQLLGEDARRRKMGATACRFIQKERELSIAAKALEEILMALLESR